LFKTGTYVVVNKEKYLGKTNPHYRSMYEMRMMSYLDLNKNVLHWKYENIAIPYFYPIDGQVHNYIIDFWCEIINRDNVIQQYLVEVKPSKECKVPSSPKRNTARSRSRYVAEATTFVKNQCKWKAAELYCQQKGWKFIKITEKDLFNR